MPIIKPARKNTQNTKNSTNTQTLNKQTKRQSKELNRYVKSLGQKPLHSEEIQISQCKKCEKCPVSAQKLL
jgi:histidyl-tRNA synthetase